MRQPPPVFRPAAVAAALLAALALAACGGSRTSEDDGRLQVVVSLPLFADFVHQVGGDLVEVSSLLPSGADPHTYEPTPQDVRRVTEAHLAFANGFDLEPGILNVIEPNLPNAASLIELAQEAAAAGATLRETDPHLWLSVDNAREYVRIIRDALTETDPEGAAKYEQNYQGYLTRLDELDEYVQDKLSALPPERRKLVTTHDAFGYMADYMGLEVAAVASVSPGQESIASDIAELQETIEEADIGAVFEEPQLGAESSVLQQAAADTDVEVCTLYSDALDDQVQTYIDMMRFNADELARCLGV
ncbi:MAG: zinc ABC transporter substrate-binding protein [Chloroflexi bacterium]|nr:zinc ABC transporter substrate-binding protein [Chloroflexota bacterium]